MILERRHPVVVDNKRPDSGWRTWAYEQAKACSIDRTPGARLILRPTVARPDRAFGPTSMWRTVDYVVDGLIAAGVFAHRGEVGTIEVHAAVVGQREALTVELA